MSKNLSSKKPTLSTQPSIKKVKKSHYKDLFNLYFFTVYNRCLQYVYLPFIKDNIYILSNAPPHDLLADKHDTAFGYVDLSESDPVFKDLVRNWIVSLFPTTNVCIRLDHLVQIGNRFFGEKIIPGQELLPVKKEIPSGRYPPFFREFNEEHEYTQYVCSKTNDNNNFILVAWDASEGYTLLPIYKIFKNFKQYLEDENIDNYPLAAGFPSSYEHIRRGNHVYRFKPIVGYDVLSTNKVPLQQSALTLLTASTRALQYGHIIKGDNVTVMLTRPNNVLFPTIYVT